MTGSQLAPAKTTARYSKHSLKIQGPRICNKCYFGTTGSTCDCSKGKLLEHSLWHDVMSPCVSVEATHHPGQNGGLCHWISFSHSTLIWLYVFICFLFFQLLLPVCVLRGTFAITPWLFDFFWVITGPAFSCEQGSITSSILSSKHVQSPTPLHSQHCFSHLSHLPLPQSLHKQPPVL